jgi:hypothetical protein
MIINSSARTVWALLAMAMVIYGQTNPNDFSTTYGVNYSSADRKHTSQPGTVGPAAFLFRPTCRVMVGVDDDTFVVNRTATGHDSGVGDLGFEGHLTLWRGYSDINEKCIASKLTSIRLDYVATVPVVGTLESPELAHQLKLTVNHPTADANGAQTGAFFVNVGFNNLGMKTGGTTTNALASGNYFRYFHAGGAWGAEAEIDLSSSTKLGPSAAAVVYAIDGSLDKAQNWGIRLGASSGITPFAAQV